MKIHHVQQGTSEWLNIRAGIPTASAFDMIITPKGAPSKSAERYMLTLLAERLMEHPITEHVSFWMARGSEAEKEALAFYEFQTEQDTVEVGFMTNDEGTIGCSPDRLVAEEGLLEIKCPSEYIHMGYLLKTGSHYDAYKIQVQGQLWISGRQWTDVLAWHPELPPALVRIERDEDYIASLEAAVTTFSMELERQWEEIRERGWARPIQKPREKSPSEIMREVLIENKRSRAEELPL